MTLNRSDILELLERLGDPADDVALTAARSLSQQITEAGLAWDDILLPSDGREHGSFEDATDDGSYDDDDFDPDDDVIDGDVDLDGDNDDMLEDTAEDDARIKRLLNRRDLSDQTREDLIDLEDAARSGDLTGADRRYLKALEERLNG